MQICHETIYRAIYGITAIELETQQLQALRTGRTRRKPRRAPGQRRTRFPTGKHISARWAEADARTVPGHWEGDTIVGEGSSSAVGTLADRCTRYVRLIPLHDGKTGDDMSTALTAVIESMPAQLRQSITWDQGSEMACHDKITTNTGVPIYFCDRARPLAAAHQ
jgi:IS30 family transposase